DGVVAEGSRPLVVILPDVVLEVVIAPRCLRRADAADEDAASGRHADAERPDVTSRASPYGSGVDGDPPGIARSRGLGGGDDIEHLVVEADRVEEAPVSTDVEVSQPALAD